MFQHLDEMYRQQQFAVSVIETTLTNVLTPLVVADHIGFKCADSHEFEAIRRLLEPNCDYLYQSYISGRRIAIIHLKQPFTTVFGDVWYLELSDQKPDGSQKSGFDHVEVFPKTLQLNEVVTLMNEQGFLFKKVERPHHVTWDLACTSGFVLRVESGKLIEKIIETEMVEYKQ